MTNMHTRQQKSVTCEKLAECQSSYHIYSKAGLSFVVVTFNAKHISVSHIKVLFLQLLEWAWFQWFKN